MRHSLTKIVSWSHGFLKEVIEPGDLVIDLTAGNGHDSLLLWQLVGDGGQVLAFDIQEQALKTTARRLKDAGVEARLIDAGAAAVDEPGVTLFAASHTDVDIYTTSAPKAVVANLGYLPGGDLQLTTRPETTLVALRKCCDLLASGGRLVVAIYPVHEGGREEAAQVDEFFRALPEQEFDVLCLRVGNRPRAPYLQVAEKSRRGKSTIE